MFDLIKELEGAKLIGISGHFNPDGDALGSCLGLYNYLKKKIKNAVVEINLEQPTTNFKMLPGYDDVIVMEDGSLNEEQAAKVYDAYFCLDCTADRLGGAKEAFEKAKKKFHIDHHVSNAPCGDVNYIVPGISSTSELIFDLIAYVEKNKFTEEVAAPLYVGMVHDTGSFAYSNTSKSTMEKAGILMDTGIDFPMLIDKTFTECTYLQHQIKGRALLESILLMDGKCIVSGLDKRTMAFYGALPKHMTGIASELRNTRGVECAIFMYEIDTLKWKVSLRTSSDRCNVALVAEIFGGGGHVRAAGCIMEGTFHDCVNNLTKHIEPMIR